MNMAEDGDSPLGSQAHGIDDDEVGELSQRMAESLHGGSQHSTSARNATPEISNPPSRLNSIQRSDDGEFYGPDDDPAAMSQQSSGSHHSLDSHLTDQHINDLDGGSQAAGTQDSIRVHGDRSVRPRVGGGHRMAPDTMYDCMRYPFPVRRYWHEDGLLVCPDSHIEFLYSQAKSIGLAINTEKPEAYGLTWSLVFPFDGFGLPEKMIRAIHFFTIVESLSTHNKMNGYVVQTWNLKNNLYPKFNDKDIIGVLERTCIDEVNDDIVNALGSVDLDDLLQSGENSSCGMSLKGMPLLRMNIGITGALYNSGGKEKRKLFGILYVHWLLNVDFMQLLLRTILGVPNAKAANFDNINRARNTLFDTFISLLVNQSCGVIGGATTSTPQDFLENPTGRLGAHNLCNPLWEPFKMVKALSSDASNVRFIGYPNVNWKGDPRSDDDLKNYINFANGYAGHMVDWCNKIKTACRDANTPQDPNTGKRRKRGGGGGEDEQPNESDVPLPVFYGLPVNTRPNSIYYTCVTSYAPIFMSIRYLKVPNVKESYSCFQLNFGGLPVITQCLFRSFLFHGRAGIDSAKLDKIYLEDWDVKWNMSMLEERFYSIDSKHALRIASAGCNMKSYHDLVSYIRLGVEDGSVSPHNAVQVMNRHFELCWGLYVSMVDSGAFMSERVTQSFRVLKKLYVTNSKQEIPFLETLHNFQSKLIPQTHGDFLVNPYDFAKRTILSSFIFTNNAGQLLNSINLGTKLDLFITMLSYSIGADNRTIAPFGKGIEVVPCCGSARGFMPGSKGVSVIKIDNPNGCGKDFSILKANEDLLQLLRLLKETDNGNFTIGTEQEFTKTSIILRTCIQMVEGKVISTPDQITNGMFTALTEVRGNLLEQLQILIAFVYPRGDKTEQLNTTTKEDPSSKAREVVNRIKACLLHLILRCTNTVISSDAIEEAYKTLLAVLHTRPPGSSLYNVGDVNGVDLCSAHINRFECRSRPLLSSDANIPAYVHTAVFVAAEQVGKMNQTMFPAEINPAVVGVLDWILYVTQSNWQSMFNSLCEGRRLNRLMRVYEARSAVMGLYTHTANSLIQYDDYNVAIYKAALAFHSDPIPLTNCGDMLYSIIYRSLSWVPVAYARCYAIETNIPVVPVDILMGLFTSERGPPSVGTEQRVWYDQIAEWLIQCVDNYRFCINPEGDSFSEYISSNGTLSGNVNENGVLRVAQEQNGWVDSDPLTVPKLLALSTWEKFGKELMHTFAVSEPSLVAAIEEMLKTFEVGAGKLLGFNICDVDKHIEFFGIHERLPFRGKRFSNERRPFAIRHVWSKDDTRDPKAAYSVGVGLHWAQLLLLTSLTGDSIGTNVHPQIISDLSRNMARLVLRQSPAAVTPGRYVEVSSFSCYDCSLEPIDMGDCKNRPEHFLRPQNEQLALDGILPDCPNFQNFAVEDIIHIGPLCGWAQCIGCPVWKVPANAEVTYNLRPDVAYNIYNQTSGLHGYVEVCSSGIVTVALEDQMKELDLMTWQTELMELGFIILPFVSRPCACVSIDDEGHVGCLTPPDDDSSFNISRVDFCYRVKVNVDTVREIPPLNVMEKLMPIGTLCYLKMECPSAAPLIRRLSMPLSPDERRSRVLRMRLSSPNVKCPSQGRLYMVFVARKGLAAYGETVVVDPWEITTEKGNRVEIEYLSP